VLVLAVSEDLSSQMDIGEKHTKGFFNLRFCKCVQFYQIHLKGLQKLIIHIDIKFRIAARWIPGLRPG
jgi:hypothetical protein